MPSPKLGGGYARSAWVGAFDRPSLLAGRSNFAQHSVQIMLHAVVREANDSIAKLFKMLCSILIPLNLSQMNWAVKFDNQATGWAAEIRDELAQWMLPSEFITVQLMAAQPCPQHCFSRNWITPKFFGPLIDLGGSAANTVCTFDVWAHDDRREFSRWVKYAGKYSENEGVGQTPAAPTRR